MRRRYYWQAVPNLARHMQLLLQPQRHRLSKRSIAAGCEGEIRFDQAFELRQRFIIEPNVVQILSPQSRLLQAEFNRQFRKAVIVFLASESFFLRGRDDFPIHNDCCCGIMIERRDPQNRCHKLRLSIETQLLTSAKSRFCDTYDFYSSLPSSPSRNAVWGGSARASVAGEGRTRFD